MEKEITRIVEAILFASGKWLSTEEITRLSREKNEGLVLEALKELQKEYETREGAIQLENEENMWKFHVKPEHAPYIKRIVTQTELTKTVLETLAVIAARAPVLQSTIIKIRTNKAYDHISLLENSGYVSRKKEGRTKRITLAEKFFEYFDVPKEKIVEKFKKANNIETEVKTKEEIIQTRKEEFEEQQEKIRVREEKRKEENQKVHETLSKEVETLKQKAQTIPTPAIIPEHLGLLEIVKIPETTNKEQEKEENSSQSTVDTFQKTSPDIENSIPEKNSQIQEENNKERNTMPEQEEKEEEPQPTTKIPEAQEESSQSTLDNSQNQEKIKTENVPEIKEVKEEQKITLAERIETEAEKKAQTTPTTKYGTGIYSKGIPPEAEKIIDKKAKKMMTGIEEENTEEKKET